MTPNAITPQEQTIEFRAGYKEGFEAGKACLRKELNRLLNELKQKEIYTESSATGTSYTNI